MKLTLLLSNKNFLIQHWDPFIFLAYKYMGVLFSILTARLFDLLLQIFSFKNFPNKIQNISMLPMTVFFLEVGYVGKPYISQFSKLLKAYSPAPWDFHNTNIHFCIYWWKIYVLWIINLGRINLQYLWQQNNVYIHLSILDKVSSLSSSSCQTSKVVVGVCQMKYKCYLSLYYYSSMKI